ncbi:MAG: putative porin precursor transrane protein [Ramlibacter sp.]|nr:putative porin precursor transrane protein [Ramlibacter sp.]
MKKYLLSSAMIAVSSMACAQSSVTLFGVIDSTFQRGAGSVADRTQLGSGGNTTSRLGFRGVEDLGGGMSASFWLEAALAVDNGQGGNSNSNNQTTGTSVAPNGTQGLAFGRRSTVSLAGNWGELRLGRDYSVQYYNRFHSDPFGNNGVGSSQVAVGTLGGPVSSRVSNAIMYFLPSNLGGFYGEAQYYLGENASNAGVTADDGTGGGFRVGYRAGSLDVALAHARTQYAQTATTGNITSTNLSGRYDWDAISAMAGYYRDRVDTLAGLTGRGFHVGGIYRVGAGEIKALWSDYKSSAAGSPETKKLSLGYVHNLSKRTSVYGTYARVRNSGGATTALNGAVTAANQSSSGLDLGVKHSF